MVARPCLFVFFFGIGICLDSSVGQTLSVRFSGGCGKGGILFYSFVDQSLSWAIPSRRSKLLSSGKGNSADWDCGVGFCDLLVGFFCGPDSVCVLFYWILTIIGSFRGPDPVCSLFWD